MFYIKLKGPRWPYVPHRQTHTNIHTLTHTHALTRATSLFLRHTNKNTHTHTLTHTHTNTQIHTHSLSLLHTYDPSERTTRLTWSVTGGGPWTPPRSRRGASLTKVHNLMFTMGRKFYTDKKSHFLLINFLMETKSQLLFCKG